MITNYNIQKIRDIHTSHTIRGKMGEAFTDLIWTHSLIVSEIAFQLANDLIDKHNILLDSKLIECGALIHDIGAYQLFDEKLHATDEYVKHGLLGYDLLIKEGYDVRLARFALCHTGVGLTKENIHNNNLPLPENDFIPITLEEEIVTYADKFHTKSPEFCEYGDIYLEFSNRSESDLSRLQYLVKKLGIPDLTNIKMKYKDWHTDINSLKEKYQKEFSSI